MISEWLPDLVTPIVRVNITEEILNAHKSSLLKPSELAAYIILHRHYSKLGSVPIVQIEIPGYVENSRPGHMNYLKTLARDIEDRLYDQ